MIRMVQSVSAAQAKSYYSDALLKSDYYLEDQELGGDFNGRLAHRLGLSGPVSKEAFFALCENRHPHTGQQLTARTKDNRTTGYDINFHCPKSVSLVHVLSKDDHILEAFRSSVRETMNDLEADAKARVRKDGVHQDRNTGELLWVDFTHQTARPVDDQQPDPHLHAHCYVFNATWDAQERRIKAGQFRHIKRDMPYYQALFHKRLSDRLMDLGYKVRRTKKSFEIEGVPERAISHFSKRTDEIGRAAKEKGITDAKALDALGAKTRSAKMKGLSMGELKEGWHSQIRQLGLQEENDQPVRFGPAAEEKTATVEKSVGFALHHHFEKASVMPLRRLQATAYSQSIGDPKATIAEIDNRFKNDSSLIGVEEHGQQLCTTKKNLQEEKRMVELARMGRGSMAPLYAEAPEVQLKGQQGKAIQHLLTSTDAVCIVRGAAGAGKTTLMTEAVSWMNKAGKDVMVVAPTSEASRGVLRGEGFLNADTVAAFLQNKEQQKKLQDGVLWVDEAGMLGTEDMTRLLELTRQKNARLILGGDTRQHSSVARGDALRILSKYGHIKTAEVSKIFRQKDNPAYLKAVQSLSSGDIKSGFERLDQMGAIVSVDPKQPDKQIVEDYIGSIKKGKNALVISPANAHRQELTAAIRKRMRQEGMIGKKEIIVDKLDNLYLSKAEKENWRNYKPGQVIQFTQNATGIKKGSQWRVKEVSEKEIALADPATGHTTTLPQGRAHCFDVLERSETTLSKGDLIRISRNSYDRDKRRMDNGQLLEVLSVRKDGNIELQNRISKQAYHINDRFGHLDHAHCVTSYASQGKTVDEVLIAQPAATFPATNAKQFYVSASRAKTGITIYTDDKKALLSHAERSGDRSSALEIADLKRHQQHIDYQQRSTHNIPQKENRKPAAPAPVKTNRDHEPGL